MKIMLNFFNTNNKILQVISKKINNIFSNIYLYFMFIIILIGISISLKYINNIEYILMFATNFRQAEKNEITILNLVASNNIFRKENYLLRKEEKIVKAINENQSIYEILDFEANLKKDTEVLSKNSNILITSENKDLQRISIDTLKILNYSSRRNIDFTKILEKPITLTKKSDKILIYNTHTSESYAKSDKYSFEYSGTRRSQDAQYNMLGIAKSLNENLREKGIIGVQDTTPHDYGTYTSAYAKSKITVQNDITNMGNFGISIDVHRDAVANLDYRPITTIKGVDVAQMMFVMGVGNKNPYWEENLALALNIQRLADDIYPGLFKNMMIRDSIYNQDLNKYSFLVEVGATGNTIDEAKLATRCLSNLLNIIYKD